MTSPGHRAVFLSYASEDAGAAARIAEALKSAGIEVWVDRSELRGGDAWDQEIRAQIHDCALFIPIVSANTRSRPEGYFRFEWDLADQRTHRIARDRAFIVPVCPDNTPDSAGDVPDSFKRVQWTRLPQGETPSSFVQRVARLLADAHEDAPATQPLVDPPTPKSEPVRIPSAARWPLWAWVVGALALLGFAYFALRGFAISTRTTASLPASAAQSAIPENSIAVLPFVNMSSDKEQEYFSDGLTEQMIDLLGQLPDLRVTARTSSFYFKDKNETIASIAKQLKVAYVLEGSVRKAGKHLRITAQLIRADSGYHLWSQTYDREYKDIFAVQDDIAKEVVKVLQVKLATRTPAPGSRGTTNTEAYNQYLLAQQYYRHGSQDGNLHAVAAYEKAIALDPHYAAAYAGLSLAKAWVADAAGDANAIQRAALDADKAIALAPDDALGYAARGYIRSNWLWNWSGALSDIEKALSLDPHNSEVQRRYGLVLYDVGRTPEAIAATKQATDLDPLSGRAWINLGFYSMQIKDYAAAEAALARALALEPASEVGLSNLGALQLVRGRADQSLVTYSKINDVAFRLAGVAMAEHSLGHEVESLQALRELAGNHAREAAYQIAQVHAWRGETDEAFQWLKRAYEQKDGGLSGLRGDPLMTALRADPRFNAMLHTLKLPEWSSN